MSATYRTVDATDEPISVSEAKAFHRITETAEDATTIPIIIKAARQKCEEETGRAYLSQTWVTKLQNWPHFRLIELQKAPLISITSIVYKDVNGETQTLSESHYEYDTQSPRPRIALKTGYTWPDVYDGIDPITITFTVGYSDTDQIPNTFLLALYMLFGHYFQNREPYSLGTFDFKEVPLGIRSLLGPYTVPGKQP